ncbi:MAG: Ldh family oxidoreductase [Thermoplasmataceae archaeon]
MDNLKVTVSDLLIRAGAPEDIAIIVADSLVSAEAKGVRTHGIIRLGSYLDSIKDGSITPDARPTVISSKGSIINMSGNSGFGIYSAYIAAHESMRVSRENGISVIGMRDIHHMGMLEYITEMCATKGYIAISMLNGHPTVSAPDGRNRVIGTNPVSISIPSSNGNFNLDFAISKTSFGAVRKSALDGTELEKGVAVDANGNPTTDPLEAINGSLIPFGGYKGFGLGIVVDLLAGILTGSAAGTEVVTWNELGKRWNNGFVFISINPDFFENAGKFKDEVKRYFLKFKEISPSSSVPGERRHSALLDSIKNGILVDENQVNTLIELSRYYGTTPKM